jgi:hypothetical protein
MRIMRIIRIIRIMRMRWTLQGPRGGGVCPVGGGREGTNVTKRYHHCDDQKDGEPGGGAGHRNPSAALCLVRVGIRDQLVL